VSVGRFVFALINPIVRKELRQRMRSGRSVLAISMYLAVIGAVAFIFMYVNVRGQTLLLQPTRTAELFVFLSYLQLALISFVAPGIAAGVISGERERQTLPVLLTTPLSPLGVVFAKWLSSISFLLLLIIMTLPLYSIVFLFGGVVPSQVFGVFLLQVITLGAIAGASVFWSTFIRRTNWSTVLSYATVGLMFFGWGVVGFFVDNIATHSQNSALWERMGTVVYAIDPIFMQASLEMRLGFLTPTFHNPLVSTVFDTAAAHGLAGGLAWILFCTVYVLGTAVLILLCAVRLRPGSLGALARRFRRWLSR
jgi:ABC-type transport system involved in multi-copper enzyme maturation permease subunit